jgi:hypothetical protein
VPAPSRAPSWAPSIQISSRERNSSTWLMPPRDRNSIHKRSISTTLLDWFCLFICLIREVGGGSTIFVVCLFLHTAVMVSPTRQCGCVLLQCSYFPSVFICPFSRSLIHLNGDPPARRQTCVCVVSLLSLDFCNFIIQQDISSFFFVERPNPWEGCVIRMYRQARLITKRYCEPETLYEKPYPVSETYFCRVANG